MNMIKCESGLKCSHAMFDLDTVSAEGFTYDSEGTAHPINWREQKSCIPCIHAEIEQRQRSSTAMDSRQWIKENGGIASSFVSDHSHDYSASHDGSR